MTDYQETIKFYNMTEPRIWESNIKPNAIEELGNGTYYYNYNITEKTVEVEDPETGEKHEETRWNFIQSYIKGTPDYADAVTAVLRQYITMDGEIALINKYNSYNMGVITDASIVEEYKHYCELVANIKAQARKDFNVTD